jgi:surfeit locus 1 family protein
VSVRPLLAPRLWGLHLLAAVAATAALLLGLWQYDAWQAHREDQASARTDAAAKPLTSVMSPDDPFPASGLGQPVHLSGRWLPDATVYVDDRPLGGRRGVWAVTPVEVCPKRTAAGCTGAPAMLVVRGWAPGRTDVPPPPSGPVDVTGWLQPGEGSGRTDPDPGDDVIQELRIADAIQHVDQDLYGGYVIARHLEPATAAAGLEPVTPASLPRPDTFTALRNLLYAVEWWVFGGFAVFIWWRWCRDELERRRLRDGATDARVSEVTGVRSGT